MKTVLLFFLMSAFVFALDVSAQQPAEIKAMTAAPVVFEKRTFLTGVLSEDQYRKATAQIAKSSFFPSVKQKPSNLTANAGYGFNLTFDGLNRSWILDGDEADGYVLYADLNGNGDLSDDSPLKFQNAGGKYFLVYRTIIKEGDETQPFDIKIEVTTDVVPGESMSKRSLAFYYSGLRLGKIRVSGRDVDFGLAGRGGFYNAKPDLIFFDINGDGRFDVETEDSAERYTIREKYVNFADASYEYEVDRFGRTLTLKPLAERLPDRASLLVGNAAPDFFFTDTNGQPRRLSDYRGKLVLLDFWGTWCPPCRAEAPRLAAAYRRLREKGFEIIGVNISDDRDAFRNFVAAHEMNWTHTREDADGRLQKIFRIDTFPGYYLIDRDGVVLANRLRSKDLTAEIEKYLNN